MIDILMTGGYVLSMDKKRKIFRNGAIAVDKGRIVEVGENEVLTNKYKAKETIDCSYKVIMPGLVDAHGHGGHSLLKIVALGNDSNWMNIMTTVYKNYVTDDYWYYEGKLSALERLKAGITTGVSVMGSMPRADDPVFSLNHARAYAETGIREIICAGPCNPPWPHKFSRWVNGKRIEKMVTFDEVLDSMRTIIGTLNHANNDRTRAFVAPFVIVTSIFPSGATAADSLPHLSEHDYYQAKKMRELAKEFDTRIHSDAFGGMIHMAVEDKKNALLGPDVHLHHCTGLSFDETMILADSGTNVSCSPWPEYVHERTPVPELIGLGSTVAIGTDGTAPNAPFDLFQAMRKMQSVQQIALGDFYYLPVEKLLEMVTIDAAKCIGWDDEIGSLEVGKKADIITIDMKQPHLAPMNPNFYPDYLVHFAVGEDVQDVMVDGEILMRDRNVMMVDEDKVIEEGTKESLATIERAGIQAFTKPVRKSWGMIKDYIGEEYPEFK